MRIRRRTIQLCVRNAAKILAAAILLVVLLVNFAAPQLYVTAKTCALACCKNLSPHSADGCAGGTCHLKQYRQAAAPPSETMCGAERLIKRVAARVKKAGRDAFVKKLKFAALYEAAANDETDAPRFAAASLHQSCRADCGAAGFNSGNQNRSPENPAASTFAVCPRQSAKVIVNFYQRQSVFIPRLLPREMQSRAPPISFF